MEKVFDVIIIGAGLSGLSAAAYLSNQGKKVALFEKLDQLGGFVHCFRRKGYSFEASTHQISCLSHPHYGGAVLRMLGIEQTRPVKSDTLCEVVSFDPEKLSIGSRYLLPAGINEIRKKLTSEFPQSKKELEKYFRFLQKIGMESLALKRAAREPEKNILDAMLALMMKNGTGIIKEIGKLRYKAVAGYINTSYHDAVSYISNEDLRWILNAYTCYSGSSPDKVNAFFIGSLNYMYMYDSPYLFQGGSQSLIDELKEIIIKNRGIIQIGTPVQKILIRDGCAFGIETVDGRRFESRAVISAINTNDTFLKMVDEKTLPAEYIRKVKETESTMSAFQIYIGFAGRPQEYGLKAPTTFFDSTKDAVQRFRLWENGKSAESRIKTSFLLTNYAESEIGLAPDGKSSICIIEGMPMDDWDKLSQSDYEKKKRSFQETILNKVEKVTGLPLRSKAEVIDSATPKTMKRYSSASDGAICGAAWSSNQVFSRRIQLSTPVKNLYLAGSYAYYGGVMSCLDSGIVTSRAVLKSLRQKS